MLIKGDLLLNLCFLIVHNVNGGGNQYLTKVKFGLFSLMIFVHSTVSYFMKLGTCLQEVTN